ncbi:hypothetical protein SAMN05216391_1423 [Lachnospiraceae bacterium KHCPX20]|nr:hypothetical protein SAMN05216391_1423 [Lachnospiraceae bacterium KHCPX20]
MNSLYDKFLDYKQIANYRLEYELDNGLQLSVKLELSAFPHLIGLHKLTDIPIIRRFNDPNDKVVRAKYITQKIKQQKMLTENSIRSSQKFCDIEDRYNNFSKENLLSLSYTEAIVNFNPSKIGSTLKSEFILFKKRMQGTIIYVSQQRFRRSTQIVTRNLSFTGQTICTLQTRQSLKFAK